MTLATNKNMPQSLVRFLFLFCLFEWHCVDNSVLITNITFQYYLPFNNLHEINVKIISDCSTTIAFRLVMTGYQEKLCHKLDGLLVQIVAICGRSSQIVQNQ